MNLFPWQKAKVDDFGPGPALGAEPSAMVAAPKTTALEWLKVDAPKESAPIFKREYSVDLVRGIRMEVTARNEYFGRGRDYSGSLRQPNGNWVFFEPRRVADKILDPVLVPVIEAAVERIIEVDRRAMAPQPDSFVDDNGVMWVRAKSLS